MTPEELIRIRRIYEQALPMNGSAREAFFRQECENEEDIRSEVERLLKAHDNIPSWLERPVLEEASAFATFDLPKLEGRSLSGYTLIREVGRGGMGSVYLAERSDETFRRKAAIKLILPPISSAEVIARFQHEREILASLDHPNIAKLLDAGMTEEGWPYFVMEFVEGLPINRWCDEQKLNISQRVELFRGVIEAVRYAHQHLVVHRDLKPGNILVTTDGVVKLLDFGVAKVLSSAATGKTAETLTLAKIMTPEYASPEQINGAAITTQSDVYSLGVVLYELLTGHKPYRLLSSAVHEMARVIVEVEPTRPSDVVATSEPPSGRGRIAITPENVSAAREGDPNRLRKRLQGDLDSILLMALRKEPERRYGSVESLAEDLQRHLEQRTVRAREENYWQRLVRFWFRNRGGFAEGFLIVTMFCTGMIALTWQARYNILAALRDPTVTPLSKPFLLFCWGVAIGIQPVAVYSARIAGVIADHRLQKGMKQRIGTLAGGLVWGLCMMGRWRLERNQGWWHSLIAGQPDPLKLISPLNFATCVSLGFTLVLVLSMIGRRFGWKAEASALVLFCLGEPLLKRIWFGELIPALYFAPGIAPVLGSAGMLIAAGTIAILVMRLIGGPDYGKNGRRDRGWL